MRRQKEKFYHPPDAQIYRRSSRYHWEEGDCAAEGEVIDNATELSVPVDVIPPIKEQFARLVDPQLDADQHGKDSFNWLKQEVGGPEGASSLADARQRR